MTASLTDKLEEFVKGLVQNGRDCSAGGLIPGNWTIQKN